MGQTVYRSHRTDWPQPVRSQDWVARFPWLAQGCTGKGRSLRTFDPDAPDEVAQGWRTLREREGFHEAALAKQVHGDTVVIHTGESSQTDMDPLAPGTEPREADGHLTDRPGLLLAVTVADCAPVFLVEPERRCVGVVHAGWRGTAAGIVEKALDGLVARFGGDPARTWVHIGPAICRACYEVGPEVHRALGRPPPAAPTPVDLRGALKDRAIRAGVPEDQVTLERICTLEDPSFYSHRGGDSGRQVGFIGVRP